MSTSSSKDYGSTYSSARSAPSLESPSSTQGSKDPSGTSGSNTPSYQSQLTSKTWVRTSFCSGRLITSCTNLQMLN